MKNATWNDCVAFHGHSCGGLTIGWKAALYAIELLELKFSDGTMIAIDTIAVENEVANNMYQRSELDYLIYNDPIAYADLILNGNPEAYLKAVTEYKPLD